MNRFRGRRASASAQKACWGRTLTRSCSPPPMVPCVSSLLKHSKLLPRASSSCPRSSWTPSSSTCRAWSLAALSRHAAQKGRGLDRPQPAHTKPAPPSGTPRPGTAPGAPQAAQPPPASPQTSPEHSHPQKRPQPMVGASESQLFFSTFQALHLCAPLLSGSSNIPEAAAL